MNEGTDIEQKKALTLWSN